MLTWPPSAIGHGDHYDKLAPKTNERIRNYMIHDLKWPQKELRGVTVNSGFTTPASLYLRVALGFLKICMCNLDIQRQNSRHRISKSHAKKRSQVLKTQSRTGLKVGGALNDKKDALAQHLLHWLNAVIQRGQLEPISGNSDAGVEEEAKPVVMF